METNHNSYSVGLRQASNMLGGFQIMSDFRCFWGQGPVADQKVDGFGFTKHDQPPLNQSYPHLHT